jgi:hypothetical protein
VYCAAAGAACRARLIACLGRHDAAAGVRHAWLREGADEEAERADAVGCVEGAGCRGGGRVDAGCVGWAQARRDGR